jgi:metallo-beta-lactamase class B
VAVLPSQPVSTPESWSAPYAPFAVARNIYYVGTQELGSYLIVTPNGHILVDSGLQQNGPLIAANIQKLGFTVKDVRVLLTTQVHFDHVAAHAYLQRASGARVMVSEPDAVVIEGGGKGDYHLGPQYYFPPVKVDRRLRDGDTVDLGGVSLLAHLTPGHTKGTTTWTTKVRPLDGGPEQTVVFAGSTSVNEGVKLVANDMYPAIASDYARSFVTLTSLPCDIFLAAHASAVGGVERVGKAGRAEFTAAVARSRQAFESELQRQQQR